MASYVYRVTTHTDHGEYTHDLTEPEQVDSYLAEVAQPHALLAIPDGPTVRHYLPARQVLAVTVRCFRPTA